MITILIHFGVPVKIALPVGIALDILLMYAIIST